MRQRPNELQIRIHFKEIDREEERIAQLEQHCRSATASFPELTQLELNAEPSHLGVEVHVHAVGKGVDLASHAHGSELLATADQAVAKLRRELRRHHDKRIFTRRRRAQRTSRHHYGDPLLQPEGEEAR